MKHYMKEKIINILTFIWIIISAKYVIPVGGVLGYMIVMPMIKSADPVINFAGMYLAFIGIWIIVLLYCAIIKRNRQYLPLLGKGAKGNNIKTALILGLSCGIGINLFVAIVAMLHGDLHLSYAEFNPLLFLLFIFAVMVQSGAEELVCRWYVYQKLSTLFPKFPIAPAILNAAIFSVGHLNNPGVTKLALANIFIVGILYSLIIYYFDSFWAVVVAHTSWNFCQSILLGLPNSGIVSAYSVFRLDASTARDSLVYSTNFGIEGTVLTVALLVIACVVIVILGRKRKALAE